MADHSAKGRRKKKHNDDPKADDSAKGRRGKKHSGEGRLDMSAKSSKKTKKKKGQKPNSEKRKPDMPPKPLAVPEALPPLPEQEGDENYVVIAFNGSPKDPPPPPPLVTPATSPAMPPNARAPPPTPPPGVTPAGTPPHTAVPQAGTAIATAQEPPHYENFTPANLVAQPTPAHPARPATGGAYRLEERYDGKKFAVGKSRR